MNLLILYFIYLFFCLLSPFWVCHIFACCNCIILTCRLMSTNPGTSGDLSDEELRRLRRSERIRLHKLRLVSDILITAPIVEVPIEEARHDLADDNGSDAHSDIIMADDDIPLNDSGRPGGDGLAPRLSGRLFWLTISRSNPVS